MSTKTGNYSDSGKNPLAESNIDNNGDRDTKSPSYKDFAGGKSAKQPKIDPDLDYTNSGGGGRKEKSWY